jgi:hypothetical protein
MEKAITNYFATSSLGRVSLEEEVNNVARVGAQDLNIIPPTQRHEEKQLLFI